MRQLQDVEQVQNLADISDLFPYSPAGPVRLSAITERWFAVKRSIFFSTNGYCTTVDYDITAQTDGSPDEFPLRVTVAQRSNGVDGNLQKSMGLATNVAYGIEAIPGVLYGLYTSNLNQNKDILNPGIYIIQKTGPIDLKTRQYGWIIVSDPAKSFSLVLARDVDDYNQYYDNNVMDWMEANGFDKLWNVPQVVVPQGGDCRYISPTVFV